MRNFNRKGMALVISLLFLVILFSFSGALMLKVFHETKWTRISVLQNQALYAGWGGERAGLDQLDTLINDYLEHHFRVQSERRYCFCHIQSQLRRRDRLAH